MLLEFQGWGAVRSFEGTVIYYAGNWVSFAPSLPVEHFTVPWVYRSSNVLHRVLCSYTSWVAWIVEIRL